MDQLPSAVEFLPNRIVSLQPSASVILDALGERDRIAACTRYCEEVCAGISNGRLVVADSWTAQADQILAARPDMVIAAVPYQEKAVTEILKAGMRFLGLAPHTLTDVYRDIMVISGIVGAVDRGRELVREMQSEVDSIRQRAAAGKNQPRVFCEEWGKPIISSQSWVMELVEAAGGQAVGDPGKATTAEDVQGADPEIIIAAWCGAGNRVPLEKIVCDRSWEKLSAVRSGRVYCISDELLNTPAPTLLGGLRALAWAIHPELFPQPAGIRRMNFQLIRSRTPSTAG